MAKTNSKRTPLTEEERAARRERDRKLAQDAVERLASSEGWQAWLRTRGAFRRYSLIIRSQHVSGAAPRGSI